jgi:hypothetical protein
LRSPSRVWASRKEELDICILIIDSPSDTIVRLPISHRNGLSCRWLVPKFEPVCSTSFNLQPTKRM